MGVPGVGWDGSSGWVRFCSVIVAGGIGCAGGWGDAVMLRRWASVVVTALMVVPWAWIGVTALAVVVLGGVGFWVWGGLGAGIGVAVGLVVPLSAWLLTVRTSRRTEMRIEISAVHASHIELSAEVSADLIREILWALAGDADRDLVGHALAELVRPGRLLFNPPDQMRLGQTERVEVRLTRGLELDAQLLEQIHGHGEPQVEEIPTAPLMAVSLKGAGFDITCHSDEEQAVTPEGITVWEFDICAVKGGQQCLFMSVSLRIPVPGQPLVHRSIPVREVTIHVKVGVPALVGRFVSGYWQWLIGTAIAAAAVVVAVLLH